MANCAIQRVPSTLVHMNYYICLPLKVSRVCYLYLEFINPKLLCFLLYNAGMTDCLVHASRV